MSIWITGDTHGETNRFSTDMFPEQKEMTKDDYVIILGDFGLVWDYKGESKYENYWLNWLNNKPFTTLFIDGNHENFDRLYQYPVEQWHGGKVHYIRPSVIHLMRGQIFNINNKKFFTFGGASSHDISDGILEPTDSDFKTKKEMLNKNPFALYRINHISWWKEELPSEDEMKEGLSNLKKENNEVDYILSHSPSTSEIYLMGGKGYQSDVLTNYLEKIKANTKYKRHFFGHMHQDKAINNKDICLYEKIIRCI